MWLVAGFHRGRAGDLDVRARPPSHFFSSRLAIFLAGEIADRSMVDRWCDGLKLVRDIWRKRAVISQIYGASESVAGVWPGNKKAYGHNVHTHFVSCKLHELICNLKDIQTLSCKHLQFTYQ